MRNFKTLAYMILNYKCYEKRKYKVKWPSLQRDIAHKYFSEFIQKLIRSSTHHYQSIHKVSRL